MPKAITKLTQKIEYHAPSTALLFALSARYYRDVVKKEIDLANIKADDNILFIGGGFCPFSAILLHQATGCKITVIDSDEVCVPKAVEAVQRLDLCNYIDIRHHDGACPQLDSLLDMSQFTIVHFALQITPLEKVFAEVNRKVSPGTKLLVRRPKGHLNKLYCKLSNTAFSASEYISHRRASNIGSTHLYVKPGPCAQAA